MLIAAFDMGVRNFAFCVEYVDSVELGKIPRTKPTFNADGTATEYYQLHLDNIYKQGKLVECIRIDILEFSKKHNLNNVYLALTIILDKYVKLWDQVDIILVEQQMSYGRNKSNIQALRLSQHCLSYFYCLYANFKTILEFASTHKTRMLGCPFQDRKKHKTRKLFSVNLVNKVLKDRQDTFHEYYTRIGKQDDVADCVLMIQAYKNSIGV